MAAALSAVAFASDGPRGDILGKHHCGLPERAPTRPAPPTHSTRMQYMRLMFEHACPELEPEP